MKAKPAFWIGVLVCAWTLLARGQDRPPEREPPAQAYEDCRGHRAGDTVQHMTREGSVAATCAESARGLVARPDKAPDSKSQTPNRQPPEQSASPAPSRAAPPAAPQRYSLEQATSDKAQLNTIAFSGLAFMTGDFGYDTFLPPGKVSDYFGFQYLRDVDAQGRGHNTSFLTRIAHNMLAILDDNQKRQLLTLAKSQQDDIRRFALMRLPLIKAFRLHLEGRGPAGSNGLDRQAVMNASAELYALDGKLAYERARVMAAVLRSLTPSQKDRLGRLTFGDSATWPDIAEPIDRRSLPHDVHVAVMTYASEMFSWTAGSLEADTYFCPERHGMYFGGFGMKTAPAMGKQDYAISTSLTGSSGEAFLAALDDRQRHEITALVELQRTTLNEIVRVRREIATELRRFLKGDTANEQQVIVLSRRYGDLDGALSHLYASAFAKVARSLTPRQQQALATLRHSDRSDPKGTFLYSTPVTLQGVGDTDRFFSQRH